MCWDIQGWPQPPSLVHHYPRDHTATHNRHYCHHTAATLQDEEAVLQGHSPALHRQSVHRRATCRHGGGNYRRGWVDDNVCVPRYNMWYTIEETIVEGESCQSVPISQWDVSCTMISQMVLGQCLYVISPVVCRYRTTPDYEGRLWGGHHSQVIVYPLTMSLLCAYHSVILFYMYNGPGICTEKKLAYIYAYKWNVIGVRNYRNQNVENPLIRDSRENISQLVN